jgi:hypothetical protein
MKYLIVKGWLGFGDRLESLKMAVAYAIHYNVQIYVDWRDPMWTHGSEDFYTYFNLVNMPVLKSLSDIPADATYHPKYWKGHLDEQITYDFVQQHKDEGLNLGLLREPFEADVVVFSSMGFRALYPDSTFFSKVFRVVDQRIIQKVREHKSRYPIEQSWGIHIRGTDRLKPHKRMLSVQSIVSNITVNGGMNKAHMVAVSDDKENLEIWTRYYPNTYVVSHNQQNVAVGKGIHTLDKNSLTTTKDLTNVDMLIDFFVLASCERIFSTIKDSRFMQEARRLHPFVNVILS